MKAANFVANIHPLFEIVAYLWVTKNHVAKIELHLTGGDIFVPDHFTKRLSRGTHGVFANQGTDGTWTITAVRWDSVEQVVLRECEELAAGIDVKRLSFRD